MAQRKARLSELIAQQEAAEDNGSVSDKEKQQIQKKMVNLFTNYRSFYYASAVDNFLKH